MWVGRVGGFGLPAAIICWNFRGYLEVSLLSSFERTVLRTCLDVPVFAARKAGRRVQEPVEECAGKFCTRVLSIICAYILLLLEFLLLIQLDHHCNNRSTSWYSRLWRQLLPEMSQFSRMKSHGIDQQSI